MKKISVIIPCFNDGSFLEQAIESIGLSIYTSEFEVVIVNDGSTEKNTLFILEKLRSRDVKVIDQTNQGLGAARNKGIAHAAGEYILPLDCDNRINPTVFLEAAELMDRDNSIVAVFTDVIFFGEKSFNVVLGGLDKKRLITDNYIDACALIRKDKLIQLGCYSTDMPYMGHEDWELWIKFLANDCTIEYLPKFGFYYNYRNDSMLRSLGDHKIRENRKYVYAKYHSYLNEFLAEIVTDYTDVLRDVKLKSKRLDNINTHRLKAIIKLMIGRVL